MSFNQKQPPEPSENLPFTPEEWATCIKVLKQLKDDPFQNPDNQVFSGLITKIYRKATKTLRKAGRADRKKGLERIRQSSVLYKNARYNTSFYGNEEANHNVTFSESPEATNCYICSRPYTSIHSFYHRLCPECAALNLEWRNRSVDLTGQNVIITGGRVKVGYAAALKFLRFGADVTVTTRFPGIAFNQFREENDYDEWKDRLHLHGLDLRNLKAVRTFITLFKLERGKLNILVNNAAQTIKYDEQYYAHLMAAEQKFLPLARANGAWDNVTPVMENSNTLFAAGSERVIPELSRFGLPVDHREKTSWNSNLSEIGLEELLEVNLINHISPYLLIQGFTSLMQKDYTPRFIINVTSSEGQFSYGNKTVFHPHTNMTKAALNMLTRTSGKEYESKRTYMTAVDVGWISTGATEKLREQQFEAGYIPPLDSVDGAARILHPIIERLSNPFTSTSFAGRLLKNYKIQDW